MYTPFRRCIGSGKLGARLRIDKRSVRLRVNSEQVSILDRRGSAIKILG